MRSDTMRRDILILMGDDGEDCEVRVATQVLEGAGYRVRRESAASSGTENLDTSEYEAILGPENDWTNTLVDLLRKDTDSGSGRHGTSRASRLTHPIMHRVPSLF